MGRKSIKENKNKYQLLREKAGLTREQAGELLGTVSADKIAKIEGGKCIPHPEEVLLLSQGYKSPHLCNSYCAQECPIGRQYVPEVQIKDLAQIILEMLASLNAVKGNQDRLIEIAADGKITKGELPDFMAIQKELERASIAVETLQLWTERMIATGEIEV